MFSVVIPAFNMSKTLGGCINSVLRQTYSQWEAIVVDDGSTDDFAGAMLPFADDPRVRSIHQKNSGASAARNTGIAAAQGEWICFADADDEWLPNHLETLAEMTGSYPHAGLYCTAHCEIFPVGVEKDNSSLFTEKGTFLVEDFFTYTEKLQGLVCLNTISCCVAKRVTDAIGGFEVGVRLGEDTDFFLRIAAYYDIVLNGTVTTVYHRERSTATSDGRLDFDWLFEKRESELLADTRMPQQKRDSLFLYMERFRIHKCRHYLLAGKRKEARAVYGQLSRTPALQRKRLVTRCMLLVPPPLLRWMYNLNEARL